VKVVARFRFGKTIDEFGVLLQADQLLANVENETGVPKESVNGADPFDPIL